MSSYIAKCLWGHLRIANLKEAVSKADLNDEWLTEKEELEEKYRQRILYKYPKEGERLALTESWK